MSYILILFLLQMSVGMMITVTLLPTKLVDKHFFRSTSFWALLFSIIALVLQRRTPLYLPELFLAPKAFQPYFSYLFMILCFFLWVRIRFKDIQVSRWELLLIAFVGMVATTSDSLRFLPSSLPATIQHILLPLNFLSTGLLLGGFLTGMMFGHHYLMNTDMPKKLLLTMSWILIGVLIVRIVVVAATLVIYKTWIFPHSNFLANLTSLQGHGIFFWQRVLVGLLIPSVVVGLIWGTARIGSNQSATGIMYVAIAFVFIGELAARYLFLLSGIPL